MNNLLQKSLAPFRPFFGILKKIRPPIFPAAQIFVGPLLSSAAEMSAPWQHWPGGRARATGPERQRRSDNSCFNLFRELALLHQSTVGDLEIETSQKRKSIETEQFIHEFLKIHFLYKRRVLKSKQALCLTTASYSSLCFLCKIFI
jgi:hypothetical protein